MSSTRFRYALEPLRLARQWALDALMTDLSRLNDQIAAMLLERQEVERQIADVREQWLAAQGAGRMLASTQLELTMRYMQDAARRKAQLSDQHAALEQERDGVVQQLAEARRRLEAVDEHRAEQRQAFERSRASGDFKLADDQWSILQVRRVLHELDG
jgi:predicted  nucleic acid-binding Zn-ribbon protein